METLFNRAHARGTTLLQTMNDKGYYPAVSIKGKSFDDTDAGLMQEALGRVVSGSNISGGATGNASGKVMFAGGPQTYSPGTGERFGIEGPDIGRAFLGGASLPQYATNQRTLQIPQSNVAYPVGAGMDVSSMGRTSPAGVPLAPQQQNLLTALLGGFQGAPPSPVAPMQAPTAQFAPLQLRPMAQLRIPPIQAPYGIGRA